MKKKILLPRSILQMLLFVYFSMLLAACCCQKTSVQKALKLLLRESRVAEQNFTLNFIPFSLRSAHAIWGYVEHEEFCLDSKTVGMALILLFMLLFVLKRLLNVNQIVILSISFSFFPSLSLALSLSSTNFYFFRLSS